MDQASVRETTDYVADPSGWVMFSAKDLVAMSLFSIKRAIMYVIGNVPLTPKTLGGNIGPDLIIRETGCIISSFCLGSLCLPRCRA